jgi:hypothetical protein
VGGEGTGEGVAGGGFVVDDEQVSVGHGSLRQVRHKVSRGVRGRSGKWRARGAGAIEL